jgi:hypothetical protein
MDTNEQWPGFINDWKSCIEQCLSYQTKEWSWRFQIFAVIWFQIWFDVLNQLRLCRVWKLKSVVWRQGLVHSTKDWLRTSY